MRVANINEESTVKNYALGLLTTQEKKVCTNLAQSLNKTHDSLYYEFEKSVEDRESIQKELITIAQKNLSNEPRYLIFDDIIINKQYAKDLEGLDVCYDSSAHQKYLGLQSLTSLVTDTKVKIPVYTELFISKKLAEAYHKSKSKIASLVTKTLCDLLNISWVLADAHYATKDYLHTLSDENIPFLMKFTRNRIVTINGKTDQLKNILRLKKNSKKAFAFGMFDDMPCYFYLIKRAQDKTVYLISNKLINLEDVLKMYKIRWVIECFHRTAKQLLGLADCQMKAFEKQHLHVLYVMLAYALADLERVKSNFKNTESAIRSFRNKPTSLYQSFTLVGENS
jgi:SRSO17 transposase